MSFFLPRIARIITNEEFVTIREIRGKKTSIH